ncbi:MAG TPA: ATP-binding protein [Acidobacteriota bacterium]|nr:ATP-binding protein [Acidobacteriota bacterium]
MAKKRKNVSASRVSLQRTVDSVIVHDLKNLAFRLSALLQNMDSNYENPLFKTSMMEVLADTIGKMDTIVKRFRDHQKLVIIKLRINLNDVLSGILNSLNYKPVWQIKIETEFNEIPQIWGDAFYLRDAFLNLIENAIDAMPQGGTLKLRTWNAQTRNKSRVGVEISDTGTGMSQEYLESKLFEPFVTTKEQGMGLGVFTSQQIIALHHGKVEVESAPEEGTTFRIFFPAETNA